MLINNLNYIKKGGLVMSYENKKTVEAYKNAEQWKDFGRIVALTDEDPKPTTDINTPAVTQMPAIVERYFIDGKRISSPQRGMNIIRMSDGTVKKVFVK